MKTNFLQLLLLSLSLLTCHVQASFTLESQPPLQEESVFFTDIADIVTGSDVTLILKKDGTVWGWGKNDHGELGVGITSETTPLPIQTASGELSNVASISYDGTTTTATRNDGTVWKSSDEIAITTLTPNNDNLKKRTFLQLQLIPRMLLFYHQEQTFKNTCWMMILHLFQTTGC